MENLFFLKWLILLMILCIICKFLSIILANIHQRNLDKIISLNFDKSKPIMKKNKIVKKYLKSSLDYDDHRKSNKLVQHKMDILCIFCKNYSAKNKNDKKFKLAQINGDFFNSGGYNSIQTDMIKEVYCCIKCSKCYSKYLVNGNYIDFDKNVMFTIDYIKIINF